MARGSKPFKIVYRVAPGCDLTAAKAEVLRELAERGEAGSGPVAGIMPRATLAILVQFGCAEYAPGDQIDARRYRATARGREALSTMGLLS